MRYALQPYGLAFMFVMIAVLFGTVNMLRPMFERTGMRLTYLVLMWGSAALMVFIAAVLVAWRFNG